MIHHLQILLFGVLISLSGNAFSQNQPLLDSCSTKKNIGINVSLGSLIPHHKELDPLRRGLIKSMEIIYGINTCDKAWNSHYNFPEVGISYLFIDFGYKNVLGYSHSLYPNINFTLTEKGKPFTVTLKLASGISYNTRVYDSFNNKENIAISSHFNLYGSFGLKLNYQINNRFIANIGLNGSHISNGAFKKPNYGLNFASTNFGVNYFIGKNNYVSKNNKTREIEKTRWFIVVAGAIKEVNDPGGPKYGVGSLSIEFSKPFKAQLRLGATIDYMYDGSTFVHFRDKSVPYHSQLKASKLGATCIGEMALDRLSAFAGMGIYLYNHDKRINAIYQRIGLRYRINKLLSTQLALKTHLNIADYLELGVIVNI